MNFSSRICFRLCLPFQPLGKYCTQSIFEQIAVCFVLSLNKQNLSEVDSFLSGLFDQCYRAGAAPQGRPGRPL